MRTLPNTKEEDEKKLTAELYFDGGYDYGKPYGCWGFHFKIFSGIQVVDSDSRYSTFIPDDYGVEEVTNNVAEYAGLLRGIRAIKQSYPNIYLEIYGDSQMVINMVNKDWGWKKGEWDPHPDHPHIRKILKDIMNELDGVEYEAKWVSREENHKADELVEKAWKELRA